MKRAVRIGVTFFVGAGAVMMVGCGGATVSQNHLQTGWVPASQSLNPYGITQERVGRGSNDESIASASGMGATPVLAMCVTESV
jgi:hypothetical protein